MSSASEGFRKRHLIRTVYAPSALHAAGAGMLGPAIPLYASQLDVQIGLIGLLAAIQGVGAVLTDVPAGLLAARLGGRRAMLIGCGASALAGLALGLGSSVLHLFLAIPLIGVATAMWATSRLAYVTSAAPTEQRGRALSLVGGMARVGMTAGPILGGLLTERYGLQAAFYGHATLASIALLLMATAPGDRPGSGRRPSEPAGVRVLGTVSRHRRVFVTAGSVAVSLAMLRSARRILVPLWGAWLGLDLAEIGLVIGLSSAVDMTLFYPVGIVMDRWGRKWTIVPCLLTVGASLGLMPLTGGFAGFLGVGMLGGFGNGLGSGAVMTMGADLAPRTEQGEFLGVWRLIADSGGVLAPAIVGALAQLLTLGAAFVAVSGVGVAGALLMALVVPEGLSRGRRSPPTH